jgi:hypothetical protein
MQPVSGRGVYLYCIIAQQVNRSIARLSAGTRVGSSRILLTSADFFQIAGSKTPLVNSVITTVVGLGANFATFFLIENKRVGRWGLLFSGLIVMTISMRE